MLCTVISIVTRHPFSSIKLPPSTATDIEIDRPSVIYPVVTNPLPRLACLPRNTALSLDPHYHTQNSEMSFMIVFIVQTPLHRPRYTTTCTIVHPLSSYARAAAPSISTLLLLTSPIIHLHINRPLPPPVCRSNSHPPILTNPLPNSLHHILDEPLVMPSTGSEKSAMRPDFVHILHHHADPADVALPVSILSREQAEMSMLGLLDLSWILFRRSGRWGGGILGGWRRGWVAGG